MLSCGTISFVLFKGIFVNRTESFGSVVITIPSSCTILDGSIFIIGQERHTGPGNGNLGIGVIGSQTFG